MDLLVVLFMGVDQFYYLTWEKCPILCEMLSTMNDWVFPSFSILRI